MAHRGNRHPVIHATQSAPAPGARLPIRDRPLPLIAVPSWTDVPARAAADGQPETPAQKKFSMIAYTGGKMNLMWWPYPVVLDLAGLRPVKAGTPVLYRHRDDDPEYTIGQITASAKTKDTLAFDGLIGGTETAEKIARQSSAGVLYQASIGALPDQVLFVQEGATASANGQKWEGPLHIIRKSHLGEVSFVLFGADDQTSAKVAASAADLKEEDAQMQFETWARALGFDDLTTLSEKQQKALRAKFDAEAAVQAAQDPDPKAEAASGKASAESETLRDPAEAMRVSAAGELERQAQIHTLSAKYPSLDAGHACKIEAQAIRENWGLDKTELEMMRAARPAGPAIHAGAPIASLDNKVLEAALCARHNVLPEAAMLKAFGEDALTKSDKVRSLGLRRTAEVLCARNGIALPYSVDSDWMRAAFSNRDLSGILGNVANKALAGGFQAVASVVPRIAKAVSHTNFHTHTVYSLAISGDMEEVKADGELGHLAMGEESWTRRLATRGAVLKISRQDMINDELGAFANNGKALGRKAAVARERGMFTLINATALGASFFTTAHANYWAAASSNLQLTSLGTAVQMFRDQTGPDGDPVMIDPRILLVPTTLEETAKALMDRSAALIAVALGSTSAAKKEPAANIWAGQFEVVVSPWLNKATLTGYSTTAWYLLASPDDIAAFEIAYLNGQQNPVVEFFGLDQEVDTLGVAWRCYYDFGAALAEYRGGVKSKGAA